MPASPNSLLRPAHHETAAAAPPQVESYANMVEPIVDALYYTGPLAFDVLTFVLLRRLVGPRRKMKEDQVNLADW